MTTPLWKGPYSVDPQGGITNSLLSKFIVCRHRFYLKTVKGLREKEEKFPAALEYGNLWHECEEAHYGGKDWKRAANRYRTKLHAEYMSDETVIDHWYQILLQQFPRYLKYWQQQPTDRLKSLVQERNFRVPFTLDTGRVVILRGKMDEVRGYITKQKASLYLKENKSKGKFSVQDQGKILTQDLQSLIYLTALSTMLQTNTLDLDISLPKKTTVEGVIYNVARRPLSDPFGPYQIRKRKNETDKDFYNRVGQLMDDDTDHFFKRWEVLLSSSELIHWQHTILSPWLEQLCDWWDWIVVDPDDPYRPRLPSEYFEDGKVKEMMRYQEAPIPNSVHTQYPFGLYHDLANGWGGDFYDYLALGHRRNLEQVHTLFPELE